jgi:hypothetical protein
MNWASLDINWAAKTDTEIAAEFGVKRQTASAARKRLKKPPSLAGHGGDRRDIGGRRLRAIWMKLDEAKRSQLLAVAERLSK